MSCVKNGRFYLKPKKKYEEKPKENCVIDDGG